MVHRYRFSALLSVIAVLCCIALVTGCSTPQKIKGTNTLVGSANREWLQYQVYKMPSDQANQPDDKRLMTQRFSVRIVNTADNFSPLRRMSTDLEAYNTYYEYLLNGCKDDLSLSIGKSMVAYPVFYAFENNYNAFPFETINVGYTVSKKQIKGKDARLVFVDRVFAHDTISIPLNYQR